VIERDETRDYILVAAKNVTLLDLLKHLLDAPGSEEITVDSATIYWKKTP
jgi:hypothetical protein